MIVQHVCVLQRELLRKTNVVQCKEANLTRHGPYKEICDVIDLEDYEAYVCMRTKPCFAHKVVQSFQLQLPVHDYSFWTLLMSYQ